MAEKSFPMTAEGKEKLEAELKDLKLVINKMEEIKS